jgi:uncharacterized membrane protein YphA (DoxX/SURF4 family)
MSNEQRAMSGWTSRQEVSTHHSSLIAHCLAVPARVACGGVLIYAGFSKVVGPAGDFAGILAAYRVLPAAWVTPVATYWPWLELLVGSYVFFGYFTRISAIAAATQFVVFSAVLVSSIARGIDPNSCGCFGAGLSLSPRHTLVLDGALLMLALFLTYLAKKPLSPSVDSWITSGPGKP